MSTHFPDDDPLAARLRAALTSEAAMVDPSDDGLSSIRDGLAEHRGRPWWQHPAAPAAAAAVVLAMMVGGIAIFVGGGNGKDDTVVGTDTSSGPAPTASSSSRPVDPEPSDPPMTGTPRPVEGDVFVYYVMDDGQSPRLYREQRPSPGSAPVTAAVSTMLAEPANDPDYSSPWPPGTTLNQVTVSGDTATVDVSDFPKLGTEAETVAVQQLVYTVTANDKTVKLVKLLVNGKTPASGHLDLSKPVPRAPMVDVQGLIWLLSPTEGATVSSPVTISGYGTAFEGTISWEVRQGGAKVAEGHTQGGSNGEFGDFTGTVDLQPGTYELRAFEFSAENGSVVHLDTKTFTVR